MSHEEKQRKSKGVLLRRSTKQTHGKEIQGLVFDHPSMPKIVTVSSAPRKKPSSGNKPTWEDSPTGGKSLTEEKSSVGEKHPTGYRPYEQYNTEHFTCQHATGHSASQPTTTAHFTPAQYTTVHQTSAQRLSPPALIHAPSQYSPETPVSVRQFHAGEMPTQNEKSQVRFPTYYRTGPLPSTISAAQNTQFQYLQHEPNSPRTQETTSRRNSTEALRRTLEKKAQLREKLAQQSHNNPNIAQHSHNNPNIAQHSHNNPNIAQYSHNNPNIAQHSYNYPLNSSRPNEFSREFHLNVWRESHERAAREWNPPIRRLDQPLHALDQTVHRLGHPAPLTSDHNVAITMPRDRSLSTSARLSGERTTNERANPPLRASPLSSNLPQGQYRNNTREMRRYSTGHLAYSEVCNTEPQNSFQDRTYRDYSSRVKSTEGTTARVPTAESIRRSSNLMDEYNLLLRNAKARNSQAVNSNHSRSSSSNSIEDYNPAVRNAESRNSQAVNSGHPRSSSSNSIEGYRPVVRNAEGRNSQALNSGHPRSLSSNSIEDYNPVVRNAEEHNTQAVNSSHLRSSFSNSIDDCNPVVRNAEGRNLEVLNAANIRTHSKTNEDYNPVVRSAEGKNLEHISSESEAETNIQRRRRRIKRQYSPTVVVISDSDDEEMRIVTPGSNEESDQDVFTVEPVSQAGQPKLGVPENRGSTHSYENEDSCIITKIKRPDEKRSCSHKCNKAGKTGQESRVYDVNNNESRAEMGTSEEQSREGMGISSEQSREGVERSYRSVLYEREITGKTSTQRVIMSEQLLVNNRGTKRHLEDKRQFFVAGSAEIAGNSLDDAARKIRRVSCNELESRNIEKRSSTDCHPDECHSGPRITKSYKDIPALVRSRSENDEQIGKPKWKSELTRDISTFSMQKKNPGNMNANVEPIKNSKLSSKTASKMKSHCNVCFDRSASEVQPELVSRDEIRCRNCDRVMNEYDSHGSDIARTLVKFQKSGPKPTGIVVGIKQDAEQPLEAKAATSEIDLKQQLECKTVSSKKTIKNSCKTYALHEDNDVMYKDKILSKVSDDLGVLHFSAVKKNSDVTWTNSKDHVKNTRDSRDHSSQQWEAYSLKLEQEQMAKHSCDRKENNSSNIKRNSWQESKKTCASEESVSRFRKRAHSGENVETLPRKSYRFHDVTEKLCDEYKQQRMPEENGTEIRFDSSDKVIESEILDRRDSSENETPNTDIQSSYSGTTTVTSKTQEFSSVEDKPCEIPPSEETFLEVSTQEKDPYEIRPSISPSIIEEKAPGEEPEANQSPQKEELSLQEWTEILQGRITQVRESIEEEKAPWKTKNKKKVLEKLENHLTWLTGPDVDETIFVSRKLQFFQTMRKQYELMKKVKTQRHTMKISDGPVQIVENVEKPKTKTAKEVVWKKTKNVSKTIKCKPKSVKNNRGSMMKKIRKAVLS